MIYVAFVENMDDKEIIMQYYNEHKDKFDDFECQTEVLCDVFSKVPQGFSYTVSPIQYDILVEVVREAQFWDSIND